MVIENDENDSWEEEMKNWAEEKWGKEEEEFGGGLLQWKRIKGWYLPLFSKLGTLYEGLGGGFIGRISHHKYPSLKKYSTATCCKNTWRLLWRIRRFFKIYHPKLNPNKSMTFLSQKLSLEQALEAHNKHH